METSVRTYEPAWAYRRVNDNTAWPEDTQLAWLPRKTGDELRLWLPNNMIGISVPDAAAAEALAWQEARFGPLPKTWTSGPAAGKGVYGVRVYYADSNLRYRGTITTGVTVEQSLKVWPTLSDGGRYTWFDANGVALLTAPSGVPSLPAAWREELAVARELPERPVRDVDIFLERFVSETFVQNGHEHRLTTEEIYRTYQEWSVSTGLHPNLRAPKVYLGRWLNESTAFRKWAGRTPDGYRRGFTGIRYPDGSWNV